MTFLLAGIAAAAGRQELSVHRRQEPGVSTQWERLSRASPDLVLAVQIDLAEASVEEAAGDLLALADPSSSSFGKYWSPSDVTSAFSLPERDIKAALLWVESTTELPPSALRISPCRCRVDFNATVGQLETLLNAEYYVYKHIPTGETSVACEQYSLPKDILPLVDFIIPTIFPVRDLHNIQSITTIELDDSSVASFRLSKRQRQVDCNEFTTPQCLRDWYRIPARDANYTIHPNSTFGIFQPSGADWIPEDLDLFFSNFEPSLAGQRPEMQRLQGGHHNPTFVDLAFHLEANLDFEYAMALAWPQPVVNIQVGDVYQSGNLNNMLAAYDAYYCDKLDSNIDPQYPNQFFEDGYQSIDCGTHTPPRVISISYAWAEADFPEEYLRRQCREYLKLALQGVTVLASTGDEGTIGRQSECPTDEAEHRPLHVSFPASCPWVTAVGGTMKRKLGTNQTTTANTTTSVSCKHRRETVYTRLTAGRTTNSSSTGGFSSVFGAPRYQQSATGRYLAGEADRLASLNMTSLFNAGGRGVPDVSALAADYLVAVGRGFRRVFGTSASAPVVAAMLAMVNSERMLVGKGPVGFVNPVLYAHPEVFEDVVYGENAGCFEGRGFRAREGWDAATGLGSPDYRRLLKLYMQLP